jgi:hypothetical protein
MLMSCFLDRESTSENNRWRNGSDPHRLIHCGGVERHFLGAGL